MRDDGQVLGGAAGAGRGSVRPRIDQERRMVRGDARRDGDAGALVIGRDYGALGVIRSLGRHGIRVWHLQESTSNATVSRFVHKRMPWPGDASEAEQVHFLIDLADRHGLDGWAIFPTSDEPAAMSARQHDALVERFRLTTPSWAAMRWAYDKRLTYRLAEQLGIDYPWTRVPRDRDELATLDCPFPVILKPAIKPEWSKLTAAKAWRIDDREALLARYDEACAVVDPDTVMIQELIPGGGEAQLSFAALCDAGRPIAWVVARRTRQLPLDFGRFSTFVETIDHPEIEEPSRKLLAAMDYTGLIEIEYKRDPRTGVYKPLDLNGRIWAWHTLGRKAGVDFPYLQWRVLQGDRIPETRAIAGVRWMRALTDVSAATQVIRNGMLGPLDYLRSFLPPVEFAIFAVDDPLPALVDAPLMAYRAWNRRNGTRRDPRPMPPPAAQRGSEGRTAVRPRVANIAVRGWEDATRTPSRAHGRAPLRDDRSGAE
jgi:D-aspartate ligase